MRSAAQLAPIDFAQFRADIDSVIDQDFDA
jgi:hypothetical protein